MAVTQRAQKLQRAFSEERTDREGRSSHHKFCLWCSCKYSARASCQGRKSGNPALRSAALSRTEYGGRGAFAPKVSLVVGLRDRKSTRLNSSHGSISYAVF